MKRKKDFKTINEVIDYQDLKNYTRLPQVKHISKHELKKLNLKFKKMI